MGYWTKRLLNLLTLGLKFKPWSIYYCLECRKWVSRTHQHRRKFKAHRVYAFGWLKDPKDPRDLTWRKLFRAIPKIPRRVDLRKKDFPILNQGNEGSCVGQAGAGLKNWWELEQKDYPREEQGLSPRYIYNLARALEGRLSQEGAYLRDALKGLQKYGTCTWAKWPYQPWVDSDVDPRDRIPLELTQPWQIESYVRLESAEEVLEALASGVPVYAGVLWFRNWIIPGPDGKLPRADGKLPRADDRVVGGHAILLLGYDPDEGYILFANSWGSYWGDRGYGWMSISDLRAYFRYADFWTVVDKRPSPGPNPNPEPKPAICKILDQFQKQLDQLKKKLGCKE